MSDAIAPLHDRPIAEGRWIRLQERSFMRSNKLHRYEMAVRRGCKGIVACLPVTHQGEIVFLSQYRIPLLREVTELVAGLVEEGETPELALRRELSEEARLTPGTFRKWTTFPTSPGLTDEKIETYLALDCTADLAGSSSGEASEQIECHRIARADAWDWLLHRADSGMVDPKAFAVLAWYLHLCKTF